MCRIMKTISKVCRDIMRFQQLPYRALVGCLLCLSVAGCEFRYSVDGEPVTDRKTTATETTKTSGVDLPVARVMTYNIQYLNVAAASDGDRIAKLQTIIRDIAPTVVAVQEAADRAAMELVFPANEWLVVIDDDSHDRQDVAFAVRRPWKLTGIDDDLDADDDNFLGDGRTNESYFPNRRDALFINVAAPDGSAAFTAVNVHAKARVGGRAKTEPRRNGHSRFLVEAFRGELKGRNIVLMGDFNDAPDDASLNILETGEAEAMAGDNAAPGAFMVNLAQPLWEQDRVTLGADFDRVDWNGRLNNAFPNARERNSRGRGRDTNTGPIMFDQILVSHSLAKFVVPRSTEIYRKPIALEGEGKSRPSDHLPMFADIDL